MAPIVISWTIPTPTGLWYRAVVVIDRGLFLTSEMDVSTLQRITVAASAGTKAVVSELLDHDRFKKPAFIAMNDLTGMRCVPTVGMLEIDAGERQLTARIPKRDRLTEVGTELAKAVASMRAATPS